MNNNQNKIVPTLLVISLTLTIVLTSANLFTMAKGKMAKGNMAKKAGGCNCQKN